MTNRKFAFVTILLGVTTACGQFQILSNRSQQTSRFVSPAGADHTYLHDTRPTFYRVINEFEYPGEKTRHLTNLRGDVVATVTHGFAKGLALEGSGILENGRVLNYVGAIGDTYRFDFVDAPYGVGHGGKYKLIPYRTIAVDRSVIEIETVVYLPTLDGIQLPGGEIHDGYFLAHDVGGAINGRRIDFFVGREPDVDNSFTRAGVRNMEPIPIYRVTGATARRIAERHLSQYE